MLRLCCTTASVVKRYERLLLRLYLCTSFSLPPPRAGLDQLTIRSSSGLINVLDAILPPLLFFSPFSFPTCSVDVILANSPESVFF